MQKLDYFNSVTDQVKALAELAEIQSEKCFDLKKLNTVLSPETAKKIKRVILTGCGDSYSAAGAMLLGFKKLSGLRKCDTPDIMDFCRFYTSRDVCKGYSPDEVLVVSISFSGGSVRVAEALEKGNAQGAHTVLITRNPDSRGGRAAQHVYDMETPAGCNSPGLRSYYASMVGISALGAYLGLCNGHITEERFWEVKKQISQYTATFMKDFERIDDLMFQQAVRMKDLTKFELIADWNEGFSAQFVEEKFIECGGVYAHHTNSEEYVHISAMVRCADEYGMIIMVNEADPSLNRMRATLGGCLGQKRPTIVVTDADPDLFKVNVDNDMSALDHLKINGGSMFRLDEGRNGMAEATEAVVCRIAKAPEQWMSPLVDFVPGSLLAGYQAAVNERNFFGGRYDFRTQTWNMG